MGLHKGQQVPSQSERLLADHRLHSLELDAGTKLLNLQCHYQTGLFLSIVQQSFIVCHYLYLLVQVTTLCQVSHCFPTMVPRNVVNCTRKKSWNRYIKIFECRWKIPNILGNVSGSKLDWSNLHALPVASLTSSRQFVIKIILSCAWGYW